MQTYKNWEAIIIDDGSTDRTPEIINRFAQRDRRIHFVRQRNAGVVKTDNRGLEMSTGKYVSFLASDDFYTPERLEKLVPVLEKNSQLGFVCSDATYVDDLGNSTGLVMQPVAKQNFNLPKAQRFKQLLRGNFVIALSVLFRRNFALAVGSLDESIPNVEDWDLWLRLAAKHEISFVDLPLCYYRRHSQNSSRNFLAMYEGQRRTLLKNVKSLSVIERIVLTMQILARINYELGNSYKLVNAKPRARLAYARAFMLQPLNSDFRTALFSTIRNSSLKNDDVK